MSGDGPVLHIICGKIAAGKSTLARKLAERPRTVLISEDEWLANLFGDQMSTLADYVRFSAKLRTAMAGHVPKLLDVGVSVVLDYPANTIETRQWMKTIVDATKVDHQLHLLMPSDEVCLERLRQRNASGEHPFAATEEQFHRVSKHFVPPAPDEGFNVVHHDVAA